MGSNLGNHLWEPCKGRFASGVILSVSGWEEEGWQLPLYTGPCNVDFGTHPTVLTLEFFSPV